MTTIELKNKVIDKITQVDNMDILNDIYRILDEDFDDSDIIVLTSEQIESIELARAEVAHNQFITDEQSNKLVEEWMCIRS